MKRLMMLIVLLLIPLTGVGEVPCTDCTIDSRRVVGRFNSDEGWRASSSGQWRSIIARGHQRAVVLIQCADRDGRTSFGSGVLVSWRGKKLVLTAFHVIKDANRVLVRLITGKSAYAKTLGYDSRWDVAVLEIGDVDPTVVPARVAEGAAATPTMKPPQRLWTCGFAGPNSQLMRIEGKVRGFRTWRNPPSGPTDWVAITGSFKSGASGGPVFNDRGRVVAIFWGADKSEMVATQAGKLHAVIRKCCSVSRLRRPLVKVEPRVGSECSGCSSLREQVAALQKSVTALEARECASGEMGPAGEDADCQALVLQVSEIKNLANQALVAANKPLYVKKVNTVTGEETVEEVHLGEGLIFKMTPHQLLAEREAQ